MVKYVFPHVSMPTSIMAYLSFRKIVQKKKFGFILRTPTSALYRVSDVLYGNIKKTFIQSIVNYDIPNPPNTLNFAKLMPETKFRFSKNLIPSKNIFNYDVIDPGISLALGQ